MDDFTSELEREIEFTVDHAVQLAKSRSKDNTIGDNDYRAIFLKISPEKRAEFEQAFQAAGLKRMSGMSDNQFLVEAISELKTIFDRDGFVNEEEYNAICDKYAPDTKTVFGINSWIITNRVVLKRKPKVDVSKKYKEEVVNQVRHPNVNKYSSLCADADFLEGEKKEVERAIQENVKDVKQQKVMYNLLTKIDTMSDLRDMWDTVWQYRDDDHPSGKSQPVKREPEQEFAFEDDGESLELASKGASISKTGYSADSILENILENVQVIKAEGDVYYGDTDSPVFIGAVWTDTGKGRPAALYVSNMNKSDALTNAFEMLEEYVLASEPDLIEDLKREHGQDWKALFANEFDGKPIMLSRESAEEILGRFGIHIINLHGQGASDAVTRRESRYIRQGQMLKAKLELLKRNLSDLKSSFTRFVSDNERFLNQQTGLVSGIQTEAENNSDLFDESAAVLESFDDVRYNTTNLKNSLSESESKIAKMINLVKAVLE